MTAKSDAAGAFKQEVCSLGHCYYCGKKRSPSELEACHLIPKQRLIDNVPRSATDSERWAIVYDPRLAVAGCPGCHHRSHHAPEGRYIKLTFNDLPRSAFEAAREYGLMWSLNRDFA